MTSSIRKTNIWEPMGFYAIAYQFQELRMFILFRGISALQYTLKFVVLIFIEIHTVAVPARLQTKSQRQNFQFQHLNEIHLVFLF